MSLDNRHRARPSRRRLLDLHWKARDLEAVIGQGVEVGELLHVAIADLAPRLVALPDDAGVAGFLVALSRIAERRVPAPRVGAGDPNALPEQKQRRLAPHAAAGIEEARLRHGARGDAVFAQARHSGHR